MKLLKNIDQILIGWGVSPQAAMAVDEFIAFALILLLAFVADAICRKVLLKVIARIVKQTKATWDDILFDHSVMVHLSRMVAPVIIYLCIPIAFAGSTAMAFVQRLCLIYIIVTFLSLLDLIKHRVITYTIDEDEMIWIIKGEDMYETAAGH